MDFAVIDSGEYLRDVEIIYPIHLRAEFRKELGSLIWRHQSRPDVGYNIPKIATDATPSCTDRDKAHKTISLYNKTERFLKSPTRKIFYRPPPNQGLKF